MAKRKAATTMSDTMETVKPYLARALNDEEFRNDLKDALAAARELYGPLSKQNGVTAAPRARSRPTRRRRSRCARAIDDLLSAKDTLQGKKKKGHKGRNMVLLAGIVAGALYNPWTGPQTREKLLDMIAGQDDLQPLDTFDDDRRRRRRRSRSLRRRAAAADGRRGRQGDQVEGLLLGEADGYGFALERASPPASARCSAPGTRPLAPEMSLASSSTAPARADATGSPPRPSTQY